MDITELPAYAVGVFGILFTATSAVSPLLSKLIPIYEFDEAERALVFVLGLCLLSLWAIWRWLV